MAYRRRRWIVFAVSMPVVAWAGWPFFKRGWRSVVTRHLNMFTLIAIGVGAAYVFSAVAVLAPGLFPPSFAHGGKVGIYFEAAAAIIVLVLLGQMLELRARSKTGNALRALLNLAPKTASRRSRRPPSGPPSTAPPKAAPRACSWTIWSRSWPHTSARLLEAAAAWIEESRQELGPADGSLLQLEAEVRLVYGN